jgi:hypothetical protein
MTPLGKTVNVMKKIFPKKISEKIL